MLSVEEMVDEALKPVEDGFEFSDLWDVFTIIMSHAEAFSDLDTGEKKKEFVLDVIDALLNKVDLPGPDWLTKRAIMWMAPSLIDKFVKVAKDKLSFGG